MYWYTLDIMAETIGYTQAEALNRYDIAEHWRFIGMYIHPELRCDFSEDSCWSADDTVDKLLEDPNDCNAILHTYLTGLGGRLSKKYTERLKDKDDPDYIEKVAVEAAYEFTRGYKQVTMGPFAALVAEDIVARGGSGLVDAPTASGQFEETIDAWYMDTVARIVEKCEDTNLWWRFQHATDCHSAVTYDYKDLGHASLGSGKYAPKQYPPQRWLTQSFLNTLPFVSDLLIEAAVGYARFHAKEAGRPGQMEKVVEAWLPYIINLESAYAGTQEVVNFGAKNQRPEVRWLEALKRYEEGDPSTLADCAQVCATAPLLNMPEPGPVHPSLTDGPLPEDRAGYCSAHFKVPFDAHSKRYFHDYDATEFSAAGTMLRSCARVAGRTILNNPACLQGIKEAAEIVAATTERAEKAQS